MLKIGDFTYYCTDFSIDFHGKVNRHTAVAALRRGAAPGWRRDFSQGKAGAGRFGGRFSCLPGAGWKCVYSNTRVPKNSGR